ncbi:MAG: Arginine--tRNA ligase [Chlamydiia bacterium]|nr:Arginine--tRNA ligase [Chlamydiia bacterium]
MQVKDLIINEIKGSVEEAYTSLFDTAEEAHIDQSKDKKFGDYQCSIALKASKILQKPPRVIAELICEKIKDSDLFEKVEIAGPGFINMTLAKDKITSWANDCLSDEGLLVPKEKHEKVIVDFSSPNIAKTMHVGHLRSTIIGDAIANLLEFLGYEVLRLNHVGDFGTQFGMLITYLNTYKPQVLKEDRNCSIEDLVAWYKASKKKFDEDPQFKKESQEQVVKLQSKDKQSVQAWEKICDISRKGFSQIYDILDVHLEERGESFYYPFLKKVVEDFESKGLSKIDNGATCVFMEGFKNKDGDILPLIIKKSDGGFNYATTDLAGFFYRTSEDKAKRIIVVTDLGQKMHFTMAHEAAKLVGYIDDTTRFDHVPFGLVLSPDGKKYKTRSGETESLADLLDEAVTRAKALLDEKGVEDNDEIAKVLGIASVKYADLSSNRIKDYTFSYDRMLKFDGNTAAFIIYSYVRIQSIKRKANVQIEDLPKEISISHPSERSLILHLMHFGEVLHTMKDDLLPNHLTEYLFCLAEKFNAFFRDCQVMNSEEMNSRLLICELAGRHIAQGLTILGIKTVSRM